ncbi:MAG: hypothetical protein JWR84_1072 [Caulobacter sp.]|nr:hypothetical protein [Caulobacter sp.]
MVGKDAIGRKFGPYVGTVDANRLRFFAKATGETRPEYLDSAAARAAGWRDIPAPPTYPFCLQMLDVADPLDWPKKLGIDIGRVLHGEQAFTYHGDLCAGDVLDFEVEVVDVYDKNSGALSFVVSTLSGRDPAGRLAVEGRQTMVVRNA